MKTTLEQSKAALLDALQVYREHLHQELDGAVLAIELLGGSAPAAPQSAKKPEREPKKATTPKAKPARKEEAKKEPKPKAQRYGKLKAPRAIDEPVHRVGRLSSKVEVRAIEDPTERRAFVNDLVEQGYERAKPMQRLQPGLFDVCHRGGDVTVTWWPQEAAA